MPLPSPPRKPAGPHRRSVLFASAAGGLLAAGCSAGTGGRDGAASGSPSPTERARARAAADSAGLTAHYDAVLAAHPALADRIGVLREETAQHSTAFGGVRRPAGSSAPPSTPRAGSAAPSGTGSGAPSVTDPGAPPGPVSETPPGAQAPSASMTVPASEKEALAELAAAERTLADRRAAQLAGLPGELARLLASVAAAGAAHAYLLTRLPTEGDA